MPIEFQPYTVKRAGVRRLQRVYGQLAGLMGDFVTECHDELATYPQKRVGMRVRFKTERQRRHFFWLLGQGRIRVPYRRTGTLGRSWSHRVLTKPDRIEGVVGSAGQIASYNVLVQGARQTEMHRQTGWKTPKEVMKKRFPRFKKAVNETLKQAAG